MECWRCRSHIADGSSFCSVCGASLSSGEQRLKVEWRNCSFDDIDAWLVENSPQITVIGGFIQPYYYQNGTWGAEYAEIQYIPVPSGSSYGLYYCYCASAGAWFKRRNGDAYNNNRELEYKQNHPGVIFMKHFNRSVFYPGGQGLQSFIRVYLCKFPPQNERVDVAETVLTQGWARERMKEYKWGIIPKLWLGLMIFQTILFIAICLLPYFD